MGMVRTYAVKPVPALDNIPGLDRALEADTDVAVFEGEDTPFERRLDAHLVKKPVQGAGARYKI